MRNYITTTLLLLLIFLTTSVVAQTSISKTINVDGNTRSYRIYTPNIYDGSKEVPIVLDFHGYGSSNWQQEAYSNFKPIADTANFILVHPQGTPVNGALGWNNFGPISYAMADINFIAALLDTLSANYNIDQNRIYSTGMSNGGFMSYDLACMLSSRIAAIASVTGSMVSNHMNYCNPDRPVPVMQIHGTADQIVKYNGIGGIINSVHIDSLVKHWVNINGITTSPIVTDLPDINTNDNSTVKHYKYSGGTNGNTVEFYKIIGGGHSWPGSNFSVSTGATNQDIKASIEIWRFFRQHSLNGNTTSINRAEAEEIPFMIYPDPSGSGLLLRVFNNEETDVTIYNTSGALIYNNIFNDFSFTINLNESTGIYLYQIKQNNKIYTGKVALY